MKNNWQYTNIKPNDGDIIVCFLNGKPYEENEYFVGKYNAETDEVEFKDYMPEDLGFFDLWTKIDLPRI